MAEAGTELEELLRRARQLEREYDWLNASKAYEKALESDAMRGTQREGEIEEEIAHALYRRAFQAETYERFRDGLNKAASQYSKAKDSYRGCDEKAFAPYMLRCDSAIAFIGYWLAPGAAEKKKAANESWRIAFEALERFEKAGDRLSYVRTYNMLSLSGCVAYSYGEDFAARDGTLRALTDCGERAIGLLSGLDEPNVTARTYARTSVLLSICSVHCEWKDARNYDNRGIEYFKKACSLSEETALTELSAVLMNFELPSPTLTNQGPEELNTLSKALEYARRTGDALVKCSALCFLAGAWNWRQPVAQDTDEFEHNFNQALQYSLAAKEEAAKLSLTVPFFNFELWPEFPNAGLYGIRAFVCADLENVRELALKAVDASQDLMRKAEESGLPEIVAQAHHQLGYILSTLARTESDPREREKLLRDALKHRQQARRRWREYCPRGGWATCVDLGLLADVELGLASFETDPKAKKAMLREAVGHRKEGMEQGLKVMSVYGFSEPWRSMLLGRWCSGNGVTYERLFEIEGDKSLMTSAAEEYERASGFYKSADHRSRAAEAYWKAAVAYDSIGEFSKASDRFEAAAEQYARAVKTVPRLAALSRDHSTYMMAWKEIEGARLSHARQDAAGARECYEKASSLLASTERWSFLAANYRAWAEIERGEDLSRREKGKEAVAAFGGAGKLFKEAKNTLGRELDRTESEDERANIARLAEAAKLREEYCFGRASLEEARLLDKQGDEFGSCEKFGTAAETFEKMQANLESERDRREIRLVTILAKAWQTMARAEAEASPEFYGDASELFESAKDLSVGERAKALAAGHSRFCRALQTGMKFAETGDAALHAAATRDLENAAKQYLKAGLVNDSEYVKASRLLFDAYVYMDKAAREDDQAKKAKMYAMTEKVLEASAASFSKAEYQKKRDQVVRLLDKVKGERELAMTLTEVLHAPDLVSNTATLVSASPSDEKAAGLQKFENAHVIVTVLAEPKDARVGDDVQLEIEVVNAGAGPAQLTRVEGVIPQGFDVVSGPDRYRIEAGDLNMKGRKLNSMMTETIALVMKPVAKGNFYFTPRVLYVDESGAHKSAGSAQVGLTVKELGVAGWLKGPEKKTR